MNGISLGASLGAIYQINQTVELDAGYHYKKIFWITDENDNKDMSEDMSGLMLSVNIKF
jgi:long-subunit fatty acid transport protein